MISENPSISGGMVVKWLTSVGQWFKPGLCCHVVSLDKKLCSTLSLSTLRCINGTDDVILGGILAMDLHPIQGGISNTFSHFMLWKPG